MSEPEKTTIPCGACRDLMPLVQDGVASPESEALVKAHIETCPACRALWESGAGETPPATPAPDDRKVLARIRRKYNISLLLFAALGLAAGFATFYAGRGNWVVLIFPFVCAVAVYFDPGLWKPIEVGTTLLAAGVLTYNYADDLLRGSALIWPYFFEQAGSLLLFFPGLCGVGCLIGWLLNYAFADKIKKDKTRGDLK